MLNEKKIILMARIAAYEGEVGKSDDRIANYFRNDYLLAQMVVSFVCGTLVWGICAAVYCGYYFEQIFFSIYEGTEGPLFRLALLSYVAVTGLYLLATWAVYSLRGRGFAWRRKLYSEDLEALDRIYDEERAAGEAAALGNKIRSTEKTDTTTAVKSDAATVVKTDTKTDVETAAKTDTKPDVETDAKSDVETDTETDIAAVKTDAKTDSITDMNKDTMEAR